MHCRSHCRVHDRACFREFCDCTANSSSSNSSTASQKWRKLPHLMEMLSLVQKCSMLNCESGSSRKFHVPFNSRMVCRFSNRYPLPDDGGNHDYLCTLCIYIQNEEREESCLKQQQQRINLWSYGPRAACDQHTLAAPTALYQPQAAGAAC